MEIPHQKIKIDLNAINEQPVSVIESAADSGVRFVDVELWVSSLKFTADEDSTATATFVTDGTLINDNIPCDFNSDRSTVIVGIDNAKIKTKSGLMLVEVKITDGSGNVIVTPFAFKAKVKKSIADDAQVKDYSYGSYAEIVKEIAAARSGKTSLSDALAGKLSTEAGAVKFTNIADGAVTKGKIGNNAVLPNNIVAGAISKDKLSKSFQQEINGKANSATTLAGYGITDAYTKTEVDKGIESTEKSANKVSDNANITDESINYPSIEYLKNFYYDFSETEDLLAEKYNASNVEYGIGTPTVASYFPNSVKSADFVYQRIGKFVTVNINAEFNQYSGNQVGFYGLPFANQITNGSEGVCVSRTGSQNNNIKWLNDKSWLLITTDNSNGFSDGEKINFTFTYPIG